MADQPASTAKVVTLEELHQWIVASREIGMVENHGYASEILLRGTDDDLISDIQVVREDFLKALAAIDYLDTTFHDKFDCR